jgi:transcription termination/antitermination protein NusA
MNGDLIQALKQIERERNIPLLVLVDAVESALTSAYRKNYETGTSIRVNIDTDRGGVKVIALRTITNKKKSDNPEEITLSKAKKLFEKDEIIALYPPATEEETETEAEIEDEQEIYDESVFEKIEKLTPLKSPTIEMLEPGYRVDIVVEENPKKFGRIAAQTAKQVIKQKLREAERDMVFDEYHRRIGEIASVNIQRQEGKTWICDMGKIEGIIPPQEQVPGEYFHRGEKVRAYILNVEKTSRGPQIILSRSHPGLIRKLFESEVPEIGQNLIEIHNIAREPGARSKVSVRALETNIDPLGACVGPRGSRVQMVVDELRGEKIDIINYTTDPFTFVSNALSPAKVLTVTLNPDDRTALVIVPDDQFSLAIGKEGQNARLAAKLTNWKIDIKSEAQAKDLEVHLKEEEERRKKQKEDKLKKEEEERRNKEEEEKRRKQKEDKLKKEEEERRKKEEEEKRRKKEEEELAKLRQYEPQFDEKIEELEVVIPQQDPDKRKKIDKAMQHIPDDIPVEQYVAMAYGEDNFYPEAYYGGRDDEEKSEKKKKKKKKRRGGDYDFDY